MEHCDRKGLAMNRTTPHLPAVAALLVMSCGLLRAQSIEGQLAGYRAAVVEFMWERRPESQDRLGEACGLLSRRLKTDPDARDAVATEIHDCARRTYPAQDSPTTPRKPSKTEVEDFVYAFNLVQLLSGASLESFLNLAKDALADPEASERYKKMLFEEVLAKRFPISVTQPEKLPVYDKSVLELGLQFVDPSDRLRFTFGDTFLFKSFVIHLIGYRQPPLWVPPIDRERGLQIAWRFIRSRRHSFPENVTFLSQIIETAPAIRAYYIEQLKAYIKEPHTTPRTRLDYARRLVSLGEMTEEELEHLQHKIERDKARKKPLEKP